MRCVVTLLFIVAFGCVAGCAGPAPESDRDAHAMVEVFPGVRIDREQQIVEVDARVGTDVHHPDTPDVYLEVVVSVPDTRAYEALVVIDAAAEHVHAAMLLAGYLPGSPGRWEQRSGSIVGVEPTGTPVAVHFIVDGRVIRPATWIGLGDDRAPIQDLSWVFAGSGFRSFNGREVYLAGIEGTIVGLTTFGTEMIAARSMHHPESEFEVPSFMANAAEVPVFGTPVVVRFSPVNTD